MPPLPAIHSTELHSGQESMPIYDGVVPATISNMPCFSAFSNAVLESPTGLFLQKKTYFLFFPLWAIRTVLIAFGVEITCPFHFFRKKRDCAFPKTDPIPAQTQNIAFSRSCKDRKKKYRFPVHKKLIKSPFCFFARQTIIVPDGHSHTATSHNGLSARSGIEVMTGIPSFFPVIPHANRRRTIFPSGADR